MLLSPRSFRAGSMAHAAETRIHVGIVRLKPVTERAAQHAGGSSRGTAFHDEVFAIEEIGGVTTVEREWLEPRERSEQGGGPFPAIAEEIGDSEGALTIGKRANGNWIPSLEIEIAMVGG